MKKEFLVDYQAKEIAEYENYRKQVDSGIDGAVFPNAQRFANARLPLVRAETSYDLIKEKIWSQIPFAGTLLIPLFNVSKENLLDMNGFEVQDIPKLIDLSKETGRVQFVLNMTPIEYEGLDHLDPILEELKPPMLQPIPLDKFANRKTWDVWHDEFDELASRSYLKFMYQRITSNGESRAYYSALMNNHAFTYGKLKMLKMDDIVAMISDTMISDPDMASGLFFAYSLLTGPQFEALPANYNLAFLKAQLLGAQDNKSSKYPVEIGSFLMKKMTLNPSSYYGCVSVIEQYKQNDLYKLLESVDKAIRDREQTKILSDINELGIVMDNIWKDAEKIKRTDEITKAGISIGVAAIGSFATSLLGAGVGITEGALAGMGFNVADRLLEKFDSSLSNKLLKWLNKDYMINIYNFQKRLSVN